MKKSLIRTISLFLVICHFATVGFQDVAYAASDNTPAKTETPKENPGKGNGGGGDDPDSGTTEALSASTSSMTTGTASGSLSENLIGNFHHDPFSGSAVLSLPVAVPPGRRGIQPNIGLSYSPTGGNGILGAGWQLSLGRIERSTKRGVPKYDSTDTFIFSLGGSNQELVEISPGQYRAKIEQSFSKFTYTQGDWLVTDKKGTKYYLGQTSSSRQQKNASNVYSWYLDKVVDVHGNSLTLTYQFDQNQIYPQTISYTANDLQGDAAKYTVNFTLEARPNQTINYRSGMKVTTSKRIKTIEVKYGQSLVRKYVLNYQESSSASRSVLTSITQYGSDGTTSLPSLEFTYSQKPSQFDNYQTWTGIDKAGGGNAHYFIRDTMSSGVANVDIFDINGDGLPDRVMQNGQDSSWEVQLNNGSAFDVPISWGPISKGGGNSYYYYIRYAVSGSRIKVDIFDINGDGLPDRVMQDGPNSTWEVQLNNGTGFDPVIDWTYIRTDNEASNTQKNYYYFIRYGSSSAKVDIFDINGDGLPDRVMQGRANDDWEVQLNNGSGFDEPIDWEPIIEGEGGSSYIRAGGPIDTDIFDINGDGLPDRVMQDGNENRDTWGVQLNNGSGFDEIMSWTIIEKPTRRASSRYYSIREGSGSSKHEILDINGDGLPDRMMYYKPYGSSGPKFWDVQLNNGSGFDEIVNWTGLVKTGSTWEYYEIRYIDNQTKADIFDINGDGLPDRVMQDGENSTWEVQLNTGYLPDLLVSASNGIGGTIDIEYGPSTQYDNTGSDSLSDLPFPVPVVKSSTISDGRGNSYTTAYEYADGAFSWQKREFRGFGYVKTTDPEGNYSESYFKQDDVFKGRLYKQEIKDSSSNLYAKTENTWQLTESHPGVNFAYLSQADNYVYDGDATFKQTQTTFQYDDYGNPTTVTSLGEVGVSGDEKTLITEYTHNTNDWLIGFAKHTYLLDESGNKVSEKWFYYDGSASIDTPPQKGLLTKEEVWLYNSITAGSSILDTRYSYDDYGNLTSTTDSLNRTITTQYDNTLHTYPVQTTNPLGHSVTSTYDYKTGQALTTTDPNGQITEQVYDALGRPIKVIGPLDNATYPGVIYEYDLSTFPIKITKRTRIQHLTPDTYTSYSFYDGASRHIQTKSPAEDDPQTNNPRQVISGTVTFDSRGKVKEKYFPYFVDESPNFSPPTYAQHKVTFDYDAVGRVIKTTNADSTFSTATYSDWVATGTDENGHSKTSYFDSYGRIIKVEEHNQGATYTTTYEYDAQGNLIKLTDNQSNITQIWYDSLGRKLKMDDPDMGIWQYEYDDVGSLVKQTDAKGQVLEFSYDSINRLSQKYTGAQTLVTYYYDEVSKQNSVGRLSKVEDQSGQTEFFYDVLGREIKSEKIISGTGPYTVERTYDAIDRLISLTYPDGEIVSYTYNKSGAIETVSGASNYITNIDYSPTGQLTKVVYGNGAETNYNYDPQTLRLTSLDTDSASGIIQNLSYQFDNVGNISSIADSINTASQTFVYDDLDRLTQADGSYGTSTYVYDSIGNMTSKEGVALSYGKAGKLPHAVTQYGGTAIDYDANGNMISKGAKTFAYDIENRLTSVDDGQVATFEYDGDGGRVIKRLEDGHGGVLSVTTYIGSLYEFTDGQAKKHIFAGSNRIASVETDDTYYFHSDHLGSSNVVTDSSGNQAGHTEFSPYGSISTQTGSYDPEHKFTGKELDDSTGLYYYGARYYDPELGRFTQADTIVQAPYDPQSLNRYAYCRNNPLKYTDPSGNFFWAAIIIGAVLGGVSSAVNNQPVWQGALLGALGGALIGGGAAIGGFGGAVGGGAISGTISAAATGGDIGIGALTGALGAGLGYGLGQWASGWNSGSFWGGLGAAAVAGAVVGGLGAELSGGKFGEGAWMGAAYATSGFLASASVKSLASGSDVQVQEAQRKAPQSQANIDAAQSKGGIEGRMRAGDAADNPPKATISQDTPAAKAQNSLNTNESGHFKLQYFIDEYGQVSVSFDLGTGIFGISGKIAITGSGITGRLGAGWGIGTGAAATGGAHIGESSGWGITASITGGGGVGGNLSGTISQGGNAVSGGIGAGGGGGATITVGYEGDLYSW